MHTSSLLRLPIEVLDQVVEGLDPAPLASLCLVCRLFNSISSRFLYRRIQLSSPWEIVSCCKVLTRNVFAAHSVRVFAIMSDSLASEYSLAFFRLLISALKRTTEITYLVLQFRYGRLNLDALADCDFPKLQTLVIGISLTKPVATFINQCQTLYLLCLFPLPTDPLPHIPSIGPLPQLRMFKGTNHLIPSVIPGSPVHSVAITMHAGEDFNTVVDDLKKSTCPITEIEYTTSGWDFSEFFTCLSKQFPDIQSIKYYTSMPLPQEVGNIMMTLMLPEFKHLRHLEITDFNILHNEHGDSLDHTEDPDFADAWWSLCPQLVSCRLPSAIQWLRNIDAKHRKDRWFPDHNDTRTRIWLRNISHGDLAKFDWIVNLIHALGIPQDLRYHFMSESSESEDEGSPYGGGGDA